MKITKQYSRKTCTVPTSLDQILAVNVCLKLTAKNLPLEFRWCHRPGSSEVGDRGFRRTYFRCHPSSSQIEARDDRGPETASGYRCVRKV